jgi:hypothetical protein
MRHRMWREGETDIERVGDMSSLVAGHGLMVLVGCRSVSQADRGEACECSPVAMISLFGVRCPGISLSRIHAPPNRAADHATRGPKGHIEGVGCVCRLTT